MVFGPTVQDVPLLPYERQLIKTIGITEKEYQLFAAEVRQRGRLRPAEYEHIPDVQATGFEPFLIQLAIGLVLAGAAYLLTPKPKMPGAQRGRGGSVVDLGDITGANRFTPSRGFDTLAELADYASPIPLVFGRYDKGNSNRGHSPSGGMLVTPKLVWSRMFSHGTLQRAKLLFVVGEQGLNNGLDTKDYADNPSGIKKPALEGIFLGNNALDHVFDDFFTFYWKPNSDFSLKIRNGDRVYGTAGSLDSGDPDASGDNNKGKGKKEEVFLCSVPNEEDENVSAFCHAYSPANSTQFGTYDPIANGTGFRLNYKIVSIFPAEEGQEKRSKEVKRLRQQTLTRIKIAGDQNLFKRLHDGDYGAKGGGPTSAYQKVRKQNQRSLGRNYSPRMGVIRLIPGGASSGNDIIAPSTELKTTESVSKGDKIKFLISSSSINKNFYHNSEGKGESVEDINSSVESMELAADSAMQLGEVFSIAGSIWKVTNRDVSLFTPDKDQVVTLECIDTTKSLTSKIGVVSKPLVVVPDHEYIGDSQPGGVDKNNNPVGGQNIGEAFFPLTRFETAIVKNNRPAIVTEIGLKSIVYQRLNGLCSFNGLPDPATLAEYEDDKAQVNSGTISSSILRASVFRIFIRKAGLNERNEPYVLNPLQHAQGGLGGHVYFVIRGTRPVAQYNFIRIVNTVAEELEFEFVPVSGAELRAIDDNTIMLELLSSAPLKSYPASVSELKGSGQSDDLIIEGTFKQVSKIIIEANKEFFRDASEVSEETSTTYPLTVARSKALPEANSGTGPSEIARVSNISSHNEQGGKMGAFGYAILGTADDRRVGDTQRTRTQEIVAGHDKYRWVSLLWEFRVAALSEDHYARQNGAKKTWVVENVSVIGSTQGFQEGQQFDVLRGSESTEVGSTQAAYSRNNNPFAKFSNSDYMTWSGRKFKITKTEHIDVVGGRAQGYFHELFGSAQSQGRSGGEGTLSQPATVQASINAGQKKISLILQSRVIRQIEETTNFTGIRHYTWDFPTMTVDTSDTSDTTQNWEVGDKFTDTKVISTGNPFKSSYTSTGFEYEIKDLNTVNIIHKPIKTPESGFAQQTQYSDISHYREFVEKSNANEPEHQVVYVNEILLNSKGPNEQNPSPRFNDLTLAGLSLKAGRNFSQLDQLRCWISDGIQVERLHPDLDNAYGDTNPIGSSNLFTDLVYYLFTDQMAGAGALLGMTRENPLLIDKDAMIKTSKFLRKNKLFFNGAIAERTNLRQFVMDLAPNFLCNFVISNGKFSLTPAVPAEGAVPIAHYFTSGNILEDSFKIEYLRSEERRPFKAIVRYREERQNKLPEEKTLTVRGKGEVFDPLNRKNIELPPDEQFDLTQFCTSKRHAVLAAKYFLSLRGLVTHTISFSTTVHGLKIGAGSYIKVTTESSPYNSAYNGTVSSGGAVTSVEPLPDGQYEIIFYKAGAGSADIDSGVMQVSNGYVQNEDFRGIVFALKTERRSENVYVVEQLTFSQEGTVDIVASEHPCNEDGSSKLASLLAINVETEDGEEFEDVYTDENFTVFD